ncbi:MAG: hypothetical protein IJP64_05580 [Oscillospiraceae bacterium]|nr:hypothetical protein [Oscillospiraceae bacterium]
MTRAKFHGLLAQDIEFEQIADDPDCFDHENNAKRMLDAWKEDPQPDAVSTVVVIVAGYPELMQRFINSNPGLRSRFNKYIHFSDYNAEELQQIFERMMRKDGYMLSDEAKNKLIEVWKIIQNEDGFGNGRDVRNVYEKVIVRQASRIVNSSSKDRKDLLSIVVDDIPNYAPTKKPPTRTIGF